MKNLRSYFGLCDKEKNESSFFELSEAVRIAVESTVRNQSLEGRVVVINNLNIDLKLQINHASGADAKVVVSTLVT